MCDENISKKKSMSPSNNSIISNVKSLQLSLNISICVEELGQMGEALKEGGRKEEEEVCVHGLALHVSTVSPSYAIYLTRQAGENITKACESDIFATFPTCVLRKFL